MGGVVSAVRLVPNVAPSQNLTVRHWMRAWTYLDQHIYQRRSEGVSFVKFCYEGLIRDCVRVLFDLHSFYGALPVDNSEDRWRFERRHTHTRPFTLLRSTSSWYSRVLQAGCKLSAATVSRKGSHEPFAHGDDGQRERRRRWLSLRRGEKTMG